MASYENPRLRAELTRALQIMLREAATAGMDRLKDNVSGQGRTGIKYAHLPYRSSAPGEYPTEQEGDLLNDVGFSQTSDPLTWLVGFFGPDQGKYEALEFLPESEGGRQPLAMTAEDPATHEEMLAAMKRASATIFNPVRFTR